MTFILHNSVKLKRSFTEMQDLLLLLIKGRVASSISRYVLKFYFFLFLALFCTKYLFSSRLSSKNVFSLYSSPLFSSLLTFFFNDCAIIYTTVQVIPLSEIEPPLRFSSNFPYWLFI